MEKRGERTMSDQRSHRVAVIGGDGIGPEVTTAALDVVSAAGVQLHATPFHLGAARYLRDGFVLDDATLEDLRGFDAILLGAIGPAIGDTRIAGGVLERGLLLRIRFGLDLYINYRPFAGQPGSLADGHSLTAAKAEYCATALRTRSPHRDLSTLASASNDACASRLPGRANSIARS
jgi:isocitrate/isopropylmalate dehydrogenase